MVFTQLMRRNCAASGAELDLVFNPLARPGSHWSSICVVTAFVIIRRSGI
jgi:hypothetical protein